MELEFKNTIFLFCLYFALQSFQLRHSVDSFPIRSAKSTVGAMPKPYAMTFNSQDGFARVSGDGQPSLMMQLLAGRVSQMLAAADARRAEEEEEEITDTQVMPDPLDQGGDAGGVPDSQPVPDLNLGDSQPALDLGDTQPEPSFADVFGSEDEFEDGGDMEAEDSKKDTEESPDKTKKGRTPTQKKKNKSKQYHRYHHK